MVASLIERILFEKILRPVFNMETHLDLEKSPTNPGKLSNAQRGLKRFLIHRLGRNSTDHEYFLSYIEWYNNGMKVSATKCYPEERYSRQRDGGWYTRFVKAPKLKHILSVPVVVG
jgi:hypothetical protein